MDAAAIWGWLDFASRELLLFAAFWILVGGIDELVVDGLWLWHRLTRLRGKAGAPERAAPPLAYAVLVPAWREAEVIGPMLGHAGNGWQRRNLRFYVGCYPNDPGTLAAIVAAARDDPRIRAVIADRPGPTSKADCLNRLWRAVEEDRRAGRFDPDAVVLQDAEDVVHPGALAVFDRHLRAHDLVQLPVLPYPHAGSRWVSGHYCDEFAEAHGKTLPVRAWLGCGVPSAGVGCAIRHDAMLAAAKRGRSGAPFAAESLTEDYELGLAVTAAGGSGTFVRTCAENGSLIATREIFPLHLAAAVRQKSRWITGIALMGWDRLGWSGGLAEGWMRLRDRRAPLVALVVLAAYCGLAGWLAVALAQAAGAYDPPPLGEGLAVLLGINAILLLWRAAVRAAFAARAHGLDEGVRAVARMPLANVIEIMAARRAVTIYVRHLLAGQSPEWEKTIHAIPPAPARLAPAGADR